MRLLCIPGARGRVGRGPGSGAPIGRGAGGWARLTAAPGRSPRSGVGGGAGAWLRPRGAGGSGGKAPPPSKRPGGAARAEPSRRARGERGEGTSWGPSTHCQLAPCLSLLPWVPTHTIPTSQLGLRTHPDSQTSVMWKWYSSARAPVPLPADSGGRAGRGQDGTGWFSSAFGFSPWVPISRVFPVTGCGMGGAGLELQVH